MAIVTAYSIDPDTGVAGSIHSFETKLLPRAAISDWARTNVGGYWVLRTQGWEFRGHQLWELRRAMVTRGRTDKHGKYIACRGLSVWKFVTTMNRVKLRAPLVSLDEAA